MFTIAFGRRPTMRGRACKFKGMPWSGRSIKCRVTISVDVRSTSLPATKPGNALKLIVFLIIFLKSTKEVMREKRVRLSFFFKGASFPGFVQGEMCEGLKRDM